MESVSGSQTNRLDCDVLVIGGGPAGSTVAAMLATKGHSVVLLEKAKHPRFHIGESLLPANLPLFEKLGVAEEVRRIGMIKPGAEFVSPDHDHTQSFRFADAWDKSMPYAYQVRRSEFDMILIRNAERKGAQVIQECRVTDVAFLAVDQGAEVTAESNVGRRIWRTRFVVDASGRDTFIANRKRAKHRNKVHNSSAMYAHFRNARRHDGDAEGNITIFWFEHGWFWFIPLRDGVTSVGATVWPYFLKQRDKPLKEYFLDSIAMCPELNQRLVDATFDTEVEATGNFSYSADHTHGKNYVLLGDAFAFIDPVFSSGVMLAMQSGMYGADTVDTWLREPSKRRQVLKAFDRRIRHGPKEFSWFIYRMTSPTMRDLFMGPKNVMRVQEALLSLLAGDIFGKTPIWRSLFAFKALYYFFSILHLPTTLAAKKRRQYAIRPVES